MNYRYRHNQILRINASLLTSKNFDITYGCNNVYNSRYAMNRISGEISANIDKGKFRDLDICILSRIKRNNFKGYPLGNVSKGYPTVQPGDLATQEDTIRSLCLSITPMSPIFFNVYDPMYEIIIDRQKLVDKYSFTIDTTKIEISSYSVAPYSDKQTHLILCPKFSQSSHEVFTN